MNLLRSDSCGASTRWRCLRLYHPEDVIGGFAAEKGFRHRETPYAERKDRPPILYSAFGFCQWVALTHCAAAEAGQAATAESAKSGKSRCAAGILPGCSSHAGGWAVGAGATGAGVDVVGRSTPRTPLKSQIPACICRLGHRGPAKIGRERDTGRPGPYRLVWLRHGSSSLSGRCSLRLD